jgi:hypothetical protein
MKWWTTLPYRQRNQVILGVGLLLLVVVLSGYLGPTVSLWRANARQRQAVVAVQRAPAQLQQLTAQAQADTWRMRSYRIDTTQHEGQLLNQLSRTCRQQGVTLAALGRGEPATHAGYRVELRVAKLRGPFHNLVRAVYALEYEHPVGRLASVRFVLEEDRKQRRSFLFAYLYLQSITREAHEPSPN